MKANKLFLLAMGLVAVGCNDNQLEESPVVAQGEPVNVVINATIATPASRAETSLEDLTNEATGQKATQVITKFEDGDQIGVYFNWATDGGEFGFTQENVLYTAGTPTETGVPYTTEEKVFLLADGNHAYAYYPYAQTGTDFEGSVSRSANLGNWDGYHYFNVPAEQKQSGIDDYEGFSDYVRLITKECTMVKTGNDVKVDLVFSHAFSYATLVVTNTYGQDLTIEEAEATFYDAAGNAFPIVGDYGVKLDKPATADAATKHVEGEALKALEGTTGTTVKLVPAEEVSLKLAANKETKLVAAVAPMTDIASYKIVVRTKEGYVFEKTHAYDAPKQLAQGYNRRFEASLDPATLTTQVASSDVAQFMLKQNKKNIVLDLGADIVLPISPEKEDYWGDNTETIVINGHGHKITFDLQGTGLNDINVCAWNTHLTINEATISCYNSNPNSTDGVAQQAIHFHCDVDLVDVTTNAVLVLRQDSKLVNVTFNGVYLAKPETDEEGNVTWNYSVWDTYELVLMPIKDVELTEQQNVTIDGCTFNGVDGNCRAIKIDGGNYHNQLRGGIDPVPCVLTVSNTKFNTPTKSPILVNTWAGADITIGNGVELGEEMIEGVEHVWIDLRKVGPEYAGTNEHLVVNDDLEYFNAVGEGVKVTNGSWMFEGATWSVNADGTAEAWRAQGLRHAIKYGLDNIKLVYGGDGQYVFNLLNSLVPNESRNITIWADPVDEVAKMMGVKSVGTNMAGNNITLENVKLVGETADGLIAESLTCTDVIIDYPAGLMLNTKSTKFEGCTFDIPAGAFVTTNKAETVSFNSCIFNTQGSAILVKGDKAAAVEAKGNYFNADQPCTVEAAGLTTKLTNRYCAAIEIDNAAGEAGVAHAVTADGNKFENVNQFAGEWQIHNYVEVDGGVTVNGKAYNGMSLDGKNFYQMGEGWFLE